jgi:hypothetical protein
MKKIRGDKSIGVLIHIYMKTSQRNSMCSYLYFKEKKMSCFYPFRFFCTKTENKRTEQVLRGEGSGWGEVLVKGGKRVNAVQKMCTHVYK